MRMTYDNSDNSSPPRRVVDDGRARSDRRAAERIRANPRVNQADPRSIHEDPRPIREDPEPFQAKTGPGLRASP